MTMRTGGFLKEELTGEFFKNSRTINLNEDEQRQISAFLEKMQNRISIVQDMIAKKGEILDVAQGSDGLLGARWIKLFFGQEYPNDTLLIMFVAKRNLGLTPQEDKTFYQLREVTFTSREPPKSSSK